MLLIELGDFLSGFCACAIRLFWSWHLRLCTAVEKPPLWVPILRGSAILAAKPMMSSKKRRATGSVAFRRNAYGIVGALFV